VLLLSSVSAVSGNVVRSGVCSQGSGAQGSLVNAAGAGLLLRASQTYIQQGVKAVARGNERPLVLLAATISPGRAHIKCNSGCALYDGRQ
jgi:hypothetical protein